MIETLELRVIRIQRLVAAGLCAARNASDLATLKHSTAFSDGMEV